MFDIHIRHYKWTRRLSIVLSVAAICYISHSEITILIFIFPLISPSLFYIHSLSMFYTLSYPMHWLKYTSFFPSNTIHIHPLHGTKYLHSEHPKRSTHLLESVHITSLFYRLIFLELILWVRSTHKRYVDLLGSVQQDNSFQWWERFRHSFFDVTPLF